MMMMMIMMMMMMMLTLLDVVKRNEMVRQESQVLCQGMPDSAWGVATLKCNDYPKSFYSYLRVGEKVAYYMRNWEREKMGEWGGGEGGGGRVQPLSQNMVL